jgi:hypothetical protein
MKVAILLTVLLLSAGAMAQSNAPDQESDDAVAVNVVTASPSSVESATASEPALSKGFVLASLRAMGAMRDWQGHLAYMIRNGYPLAEQWLAEDSNRAADLVALAGQAASTRADRTAITELNNQYRNLQQWSDYIVESKRKLQLANLYMTPNGLEGDALFQKTVRCASFLTPMLASGRLSESSSCQ